VEAARAPAEALRLLGVVVLLGIARGCSPAARV
jgi:hypothetical protein